MAEGFSWGVMLAFLLALSVIIFIIIFTISGGTKFFDTIKGLGKEIDVTQEQVKFKAIDTFNELFDKLDKCLKVERSDCNCFIKEIPDFPSDYKLVFILDNAILRMVLRDKNDVDIVSKDLGDYSLAYLDEEYLRKPMGSITINFDKKPYYALDDSRLTLKDYRFDSDLNPFYVKKFAKRKTLCLVTDLMWNLMWRWGVKENVQQVMYAKPFCNY